MRRQGEMRRQALCRHNASSGGTGIIGNLSSQCIVSVSAKSHTQAAGARYNAIYIILYIYIYIYIYLLIYLFSDIYIYMYVCI